MGVPGNHYVKQNNPDKYCIFSHMWKLNFNKCMKVVRAPLEKRKESGGGEIKGSLMQVLNIIKAHYMHILEYHNETYYFVKFIYINNNVIKYNIKGSLCVQL